jgi:hypothetical protein
MAPQRLFRRGVLHNETTREVAYQCIGSKEGAMSRQKLIAEQTINKPRKAEVRQAKGILMKEVDLPPVYVSMQRKIIL